MKLAQLLNTTTACITFFTK